MSIRDAISTIEALAEATKAHSDLVILKIETMRNEDIERCKARAEDLIEAERAACSLKVDALLGAIGRDPPPGPEQAQVPPPDVALRELFGAPTEEETA